MLRSRDVTVVQSARAPERGHLRPSCRAAMSEHERDRLDDSIKAINERA